MKRFFVILGMATIVLLSGCARNKNLDIIIFTSSVSDPFSKQVVEGASKQAHEFTLNIKICRSQQLNVIEMHPKAIGVDAMTGEDIRPVIEAANRAKIPVFVFNSLTPVGGNLKVTEYIGFDQKLAAKECGRYLGKLMNGKGDVFILLGNPGKYNTERESGFREGIAEFPDIKIVGHQNAEWDRQKAIDLTSDAINEYQNLGAVFACNDEMAIGASIAVNRAAKDIYTIGMDGTSDALIEIKKHNLTATLDTYPEKTGETLINQMQESIKGKRIPLRLETPYKTRSTDEYR